MKKTLRSYITFTRTERIGIIALSALLLALLAIRASMPLWVHPKVDTEQEKKLTASWEAYKRAHPSASADTASAGIKEHQDAFDDNPTPLPDSIDLNTADSATLVRLRGIGPVTAGKIIAWRSKHGAFTNIEQLRETGGFAPDIFGLLKKHLFIPPSKRN